MLDRERTPIQVHQTEEMWEFVRNRLHEVQIQVEILLEVKIHRHEAEEDNRSK